MTSVFQQLEAERAALEAREAEIERAMSDQAARALRGLADATPRLQALGRMLAGDLHATNELSAIAQALADVARELRPTVRHVPKAPPRPAAGAPLSELMRYQGERTAQFAAEPGA